MDTFLSAFLKVEFPPIANLIAATSFKINIRLENRYPRIKLNKQHTSTVQNKTESDGLLCEEIQRQLS